MPSSLPCKIPFTPTATLNRATILSRGLLRAIARKGLKAVLQLLPNGLVSEMMRVLEQMKAPMAPVAASRLAVSG